MLIGKDYFIGRLVSRVEEVNAYGDIQSAREEYGYENNLLKTYNKYNRDNSGWIQENYDYDDYGNIIKKIITNSIDIFTQTEASQYDLKGRFPIKKTNNLGLDTHIEYNDWGLVTNQIDPLGNTIYNVYDEWGKLQISKSSLGGETTYLYGKLWEIGTVSELFKDALSTVHSKTDEFKKGKGGRFKDTFQGKFIKKLSKQDGTSPIDKVALANELAEILDKDTTITEGQLIADPYLQYIVNAIKHVC
ncbi:hypothetical protein [Elizabethkingia anophelis]|uniref:hypothetical protein n=1 Tax=Elizabethkingia anophelis TaxID=1117645 RepID=UPI003786FB03